jgi:hypothetical protein
MNGEGSMDYSRARARGYRVAALRWLLTALVIAVAAPVLAGCASPPAGMMYLPVPPLDICRGMTSNSNKDCGEHNFAYDPSTRELFLICNPGQVITVLAGGKANCGRTAKLQFTKEYSAWLATQGIMTPGASAPPVLTDTPTLMTPPPDNW